EHVFWYSFHEGVELRPCEVCPGGIIGIAEVDDLSSIVYCVCDGGQVESVILEGHHIQFHALGANQDIKSNERAFGGHDFILAGQKGANDVGHDALGAAAYGDVVDLDRVSLCKGGAQLHATGFGIATDLRECFFYGCKHIGRWTKRILVRCQVDESVDT